LVRATGVDIPSLPRIRTDANAAADTGARQRSSAAKSAERPLSGTQAPLLNGETGIAAQETGTTSQTTDSGARQGGGDTKGADPSNPENLTEEEKQEIEKLKQRDREVRAHEQAHRAAGGALTGSPTFKTVRGPDGHSYAVSGEVKIDTSSVPNNPEATIRKLEQVKRAALAPSNPSAKDRQVAADAEAKIQQARQEKREQEAEELKEAGGEKGGLEVNLTGSSPLIAPNPISGPDASRSANATTLRPGSLLNLVA
jgi:hypothetical protein